MGEGKRGPGSEYDRNTLCTRLKLSKNKYLSKDPKEKKIQKDFKHNKDVVD